MEQHITLSRAARLAGTTRGELQKKIRQGDIATFEGKVALTDLIRVYPEINVEKSPTLERMELFKAAAMPNRKEEVALPSAEVLMSRLSGLTEALIRTRSGFDQYAELLRTLADRLRELGHNDTADFRSEILALHDWIKEKLDQSLEAPDANTKFFVKDTFLRIMAANIKIIPSGHEFFLEGALTILDASIRAGLTLDYGCLSGNCGKCKARIISGSVLKTREHEYLLSEREKKLGYMLMCSNTAVTDLTLEAAIATKASDLSAKKIRSVVKKIDRLSDNLILLRLRTPKAKTLRFMAGQNAVLTISDELSARHSIASCPCNGQYLLFVIRRIPNDRFTEAVFSELQPGQMVVINGPEGEFIFDNNSPKPVLFLAQDDGFAPIRSLIEQAITVDSAESFHLYWFASQPEGHHQENQCRAWKDALDNFQYTPITLPSGKDSASQALVKAIENYSDCSGFTAYVTGSQSFVEEVSSLLLGRQLPAEELHVEVI